MCPHPPGFPWEIIGITCGGIIATMAPCGAICTDPKPGDPWYTECGAGELPLAVDGVTEYGELPLPLVVDLPSGLPAWGLWCCVVPSGNLGGSGNRNMPTLAPPAADSGIAAADSEATTGASTCRDCGGFCDDCDCGGRCCCGCCSCCADGRGVGLIGGGGHNVARLISGRRAVTSNLLTCSEALKSHGLNSLTSRIKHTRKGGGKDRAQIATRPACFGCSDKTTVRSGTFLLSGRRTTSMHGLTSRPSVSSTKGSRCARWHQVSNVFAFFKHVKDAPNWADTCARVLRRASHSCLWHFSWHQTKRHEF
mmetsp:Transcript_107674/g.309961  ORF Transcript_107674/g.309961 Transcript_107674/m.309961 type:complete len:309 (-) Transcript_107674:152-1078(-)